MKTLVGNKLHMGHLLHEMVGNAGDDVIATHEDGNVFGLCPCRKQRLDGVPDLGQHLLFGIIVSVSSIGRL